MFTRVSRYVSFVAVVVLLMTVLLWTGCGGTGQSSSSSPGATNGSTQPGGSGGSGGSAGSGSGGSGTSGGSGGSGSSGTPSSGAAYLYAGVGTDAARIRGYKIDFNASTLAEVPGSPFSEQGGASPGVVAVSKSFVYGSEVKVSNISSSSTVSIVTAFRADPASGSLTQTGTVQIPNNTQAALFPESSGHNLYVLDALGDILNMTINADGTLTNSGSVHLADNVTGLAVSPNGRLAYAAITNGSFRAGTLTDGLVALNRDPSSGALTLNHQVNSNQHLQDLQFDTSGKYLLALSGGQHFSVYSVNASTGDLTPVPGSPFASNLGPRPPSPDDATRTFRLDPANKFVYALNGNAAQPMPEYMSVFSFNAATGSLAPVQTVEMAPGSNPASLVVDDALVFAVSTGSVAPLSRINIFKRDSNTGMLTQAGNPVTSDLALIQSAELRF